jgi:hypothetical protein
MLMFVDASNQVVRDTDIKCPVSLIGENVNVIIFQSYWILAFARMT